MGRSNRQRRAAKARKRAQHRPHHQHQRHHHQHRQQQHAAGGRRHEHATGVTAAELFVAAAYREASGDAEATDALVDLLVADPVPVTAPEISRLLEGQVAALWDHGWEPADVHRQTGRVLGRAEVAIVDAVIVAQAAGYEELGRTVAPAWMAQVEALGRLGPRHPSYLAETGPDWRRTLAAAVRLMALVMALPRLPRLSPPPSEWRRGMAVPAGSLPDDLLDKVRALLAKAESTTFEAEAEAFTAKAQELMARHRIDRAVIDARSPHRDEPPVGRRLGVDDPYADAKAALLAAIASANGCRAVWCRELGISTVFGLAGQIAAVEELFTSLLVQATAALRREGSKQDRWGTSRTTRFRRSFLVAFAIRIGQRLRETVEATVSAASEEEGPALLPILAARDDEVQAAAQAAFPKLGTFSPAATDREGWVAGTIFGSQADLAVGPTLAGA